MFDLVTDDPTKEDPYRWWADLDQVTIQVEPDTVPPVFSGVVDFVVENDPGECGAAVTFPLEALDACEGAVEVDCPPASGAFFPVGTTPVSCTASDSEGNAADASFDVIVRDTEPPVFGGDDTPLTLWPPNHEIETYWLDSFDIEANDNCPEPPPSVRFVSVTRDEPDNGRGDGNTTGDFVTGEDGTRVELRAERAGGGDGRLYNLGIEATDSSGNGASTGRHVKVPHDKGSP